MGRNEKHFNECRRDALRWFRSQSRAEMSFLWYAELLGWCEQRIAKVRRHVEQVARLGCTTH